MADALCPTRYLELFDVTLSRFPLPLDPNYRVLSPFTAIPRVTQSTVGLLSFD